MSDCTTDLDLINESSKMIAQKNYHQVLRKKHFGILWAYNENSAVEGCWFVWRFINKSNSKATQIRLLSSFATIN